MLPVVKPTSRSQRNDAYGADPALPEATF
jgi:hypothetical protein